MFKKLKSIISGEDSAKNRRRHVRSNVGLKLCVLMLRTFNPETGDRSYGRCFATATLDLSMGGLCIKHQNLLLKNELVEIRTKYSLITDQCKTCKNIGSVDNIILTPIVGQVVWRTNTRCGIKILALDEIGKEVLHKLVWNQHLDEVRENRQAEEMRKTIEYRKKEAEKQVIIDESKQGQARPDTAEGGETPSTTSATKTAPTSANATATPRSPDTPLQPSQKPAAPKPPQNRTPYVPPKKDPDK